MGLAELTADHLRCIEHAQLRLAPGLSLVFGENGSGKTSLLEAMFLLGRGRSFRTRSSERLVRFNQPQVTVFGITEPPTAHRVGVEVSRAGVRARVDGADLPALAQLSTVLPVQAIDPDVHKLVEEGSYGRRRWLDWAVFHVEPRFTDHWSRYQRALKQRNALLKHRGGALESWDAELVAHGLPLTDARQAVFEALHPYWRQLMAALRVPEVEIAFHRGWSREHELADSLRMARERDEQRGSTGVGAHRADVVIRCEGKPAREVLSRGQQKLVAAALILAQLRYLKATVGLRPLLLLDDPAAELDDARLGQFIAEVAALDTQLVVTALRSDFSVFGRPERVFHVEQGRVQEL